MLTDTPHSKTPGTSIHLHISKESACHSQVLPLPGHHAPYFSRTSYTLKGAHYITAFPNQSDAQMQSDRCKAANANKTVFSHLEGYLVSFQSQDVLASVAATLHSETCLAASTTVQSTGTELPNSASLAKMLSADRQGVTHRPLAPGSRRHAASFHRAFRRDRRQRASSCRVYARAIEQVTNEQLQQARLITALKTPYLQNGKFDLPAYDRMVQHQVRPRNEMQHLACLLRGRLHLRCATTLTLGAAQCYIPLATCHRQTATASAGRAG